MESETRGSRRVFFALSEPSPVQISIRSPSRPTQMGTHCGEPSGNLCQRPRCWYYRSGFHCLRKGGAECYAVDGENEYHAVLGGHRCFIVHPSDTAPALVALGASLRIVGSRGSRTIPVSEFFLLPEHSMTHENVLRPSEIVAEVLLPAPVL